MVVPVRSLATINNFFIIFGQDAYAISHVFSTNYFHSFSTSPCPLSVEPDHFVSNRSSNQTEDFRRKSDVDVAISIVCAANSEDEVFKSLVHDPVCNTIQITHGFVDRLLHRFKDDWKSALGVFRWAEACPHYKPSPELYDKLVDILGKMKQMEKMNALVEEMREGNLVSLNTIGKVMRRFAGAGDWKDAVTIFDKLGQFGLEKNTESMNLLLDTLCKEHKVEQARTIFLELKSHIQPNANTYNIFIHGWCKIMRVEEAHWTIQEMKGHGCSPCVISYSTIIQFYCNQSNFHKVYELLDEMEAQQCPPNVVTFTTIMHSLTKLGEFEEALQIYEKMKLVGCKPDTLFYNALIHSLGRAGRVKEAIHVFMEEMPKNKTSPNTSTYNSMIAMFCHHKQEQKALQYLRNLENASCCKPDVQSYYPLLKRYFGAGKMSDSVQNLLDGMVKKHHLCLDLSTYTLLIHGLCRTNKCEQAYQLFKDMIGQNIKPRYITCSLLLDEIRQTNMYDEAENIQDFMKKMKSS
ncbi:Pentatricopeptide repeat-containing protein [Abeliophyllum distichum]|uniref:Pentatricopeptide repeat-containing protein n=1 Tax=Abeliophyllum distichum TaxID=126358 RepID=A0ABD1U3V6_9LAMI